jgi:hypothetical protein
VPFLWMGLAWLGTEQGIVGDDVGGFTMEHLAFPTAPGHSTTSKFNGSRQFEKKQRAGASGKVCAAKPQIG